MNINILENVPNTKKVKNIKKEKIINDKINLLQNRKSERNVLKENPPRKKDIKIEEINASDSGQNLNKKEDNNSKKKSITISRKSKQVKPKFNQLKKRKLYYSLRH